MNKPILAILPLLVLLAAASCKKDPGAAPPIQDPRDKIAGEYEVWDTLYKYVGTDTAGNILHEKVGVFHYSKVSFVKSQVTYYSSLGSDIRDGLKYTVLARDTGTYGSNGEREGFLGADADFVIGNSDPVTLSGAEYVFLRSKGGELKDGYLLLSAGEFMVGYSSAKAVKIK